MLEPRERKSLPGLVDCKPWPPLEEVDNPQATGIFYYGIYLRETALEDLVIRIAPVLAEASPGELFEYGLNAVRHIADDPSLDVQFGVLQPRHKEAMPFITEKIHAPTLVLFMLEEDQDQDQEAVRKWTETKAEKVETLARELDSKADWYELSFWI